MDFSSGKPSFEPVAVVGKRFKNIKFFMTMEMNSTLHTIYTRDHEGLPVQHQVPFLQKVRLIQLGGMYELQIVNPDTGYIKSFSALKPRDSETADFLFGNTEVLVTMQLDDQQNPAQVRSFKVSSHDQSWGLGYE